MITKITSTNKDEYKLLFDEALAFLVEHLGENGSPYVEVEITERHYDASTKLFKGIYYTKNDKGEYDKATKYDESIDAYYELKVPKTISTLPEYFSQFGNFQAVVEKAAANEKDKLREEIGRRFLSLPLMDKLDANSEQYFEIDANTRTIHVPEVFNRNGIGVLGDHYAEILFFKIDRFFDQMDFGRDDMSIIVQWETSDKTKGVSETIYKDIVREPGSVIFGWLLDNRITKAGMVTFSVRILEWEDDNTYTYSFSTAAKTVGINSTLELDQNDFNLRPNRTIESTIFDRLVSSPTPTGTLRLPEPEFIDLLSEYTISNNVIDVNLDETTTDDQGNTIKCKTLYAYAYPNPLGEVSYQWVKDKNSELTKELDGWLKLKSKEYYNSNVTYYEIKNGKYVVCAIDDVDEDLYDEDNNFKDLYYPVGKTTAKVAGEYSVKAWVTGGNFESSDTVTYETVWRIPGPSAVELESNDDKYVYVTSNTTTQQDMTEVTTYQFTIPDISSNVKNSDAYDKIKTLWTVNGTLNESYNDYLSFNITTTTGTIDSLTGYQGEYVATVIGNKNGVDVPTKDSPQYGHILLLPAEVPTSAVYYQVTGASGSTPQWEELKSSSISKNTKVKISTTLTYQDIDYTKCYYDWYTTTDFNIANTLSNKIASTSPNADIVKAIDDYIAENSTLITKVGGHNPASPEFTITAEETAYYFCKVTNYYGQLTGTTINTATGRPDNLPTGQINLYYTKIYQG